MTRADLERAVERGIALLDMMDGDPDLEPSLGVFWSDGRWQSDDREDQCEDEGAPTGDDEPDDQGDQTTGETGEHGQ